MKKCLPLLVSILALLFSFTQTASAQVNDYLQVVGNMTVKIKIIGSPEMPDFWYSFDKVSWTQITEEVTINKSKSYNWDPTPVCYFKGNNPQGFNKSATDYVSITITGGNPSVAGNVMSLLGEDFSTNTTIPCDYCFYGLFCPNPPASFSTLGSYHSTSSSTSLYHVKDLALPATELKPYCYAYMFAYNTGLYDSPVLPALVMAPWCYAHMFEYCMNNFCSQTAYNSGTRLPELPSQKLAEGCYAFMFNMCPVIYNTESDWYCLPAEELAPRCYEGMFGTYRNQYYRSFKSLEIMATSLQDRCGNDIRYCMRRMLNYNIMNQTAGQYGRGALNTRMYWTDWGNTDDTENAPTDGWFTGFLYSNCTFNYQKGLTPLTKVAKTNYANTTKSSLFPYSCTLVENNFTYLTFDCKTNGGTWEPDCEYNADLRRVVRSDYTAKTVPAAPVKEGETFLGWFTEPTGGTKVEESTILSQTTAQTYYAQFGEGSGSAPDPQTPETYNISLSTGVLDFPQYTSYSYTSKFAVIGETDDMTIRLQFNGNISAAGYDYVDFATALSATDSYVELKDGTRRAVTQATKASLFYYGDYLRAAHLIAAFSDEAGNTYNFEIYTNELLNYATFKEDYRYTYYSSTLPIESGWVSGRKFQYNETNHLPDNFVVNTTNKTWRYFYGSSSPFDYCQILINFIVADGKTDIPTGYYPINSTMKPGTVFIGSIPYGTTADEIARSNNMNYAGGANTSWIMHYYEDEYGIPLKDNWLFRGGYVQFVNDNGNYYIHVHATTDATRTNGESSNNVIDFTAGDETLADQLPGPDDNPGEGGGEGGETPDPETPETPGTDEVSSEDANVSVYQNVSKTTTKILYNLDDKIGKDNLTYGLVDMGYGIAWADRNVGATDIYAVGSYFRWGGITPGGDQGNNTFKTTYCYDVYGKNMAGDDNLPSQADAATQNMGDTWRMPTAMEWYELIGNTDYSSGTYTNPSDVSQFITLPPSGEYVVDINYNTSDLYYSEDRWYWSSTLYGLGQMCSQYYGTCTDADYASQAYYYYDDGTAANTNVYQDGYIIYGMPVRAIYTPPFTTYTLTVNVGSYQYRYICEKGQKVTVTAVPDEGWSFDRWTEDSNTSATRTFTITGNMTYTATFKQDVTYHTITIQAQPEGYGSVSQTAVSGIPHGASLNTSGNTLTVNGTTVIATPTANTDQYTYTFTAWLGAQGTVSGDVTITALFERTTNSYVITFQNEDGTKLQSTPFDYGTTPVYGGAEPEKPADNQYTYKFSGWSPELSEVNGTATYKATFTPQTRQYTVTFASMTGGTIAVTSGGITVSSGDKVDYGTVLTVTAIPDEGYVFGSWLSGTTASVTVKGDTTIGASFIEEDTTIPQIDLYDNANPKANGVTTTNSALLADYAGRTVNVTLHHTFTANVWNTLCVPFDFDLEDHEIDGMVFEMANCTTSPESGIDITFDPAYLMEAGKPYLVKTPVAMTEIVFNGVELKTFTPGTTVAPSGDVEFRAVVETTYITNKTSIYIGSGNRLFYANASANGGKGSRIRGYRGYFEILNTNGMEYAQPRVRISVAGNEQTVLTTDGEETETRKYMDNGILVIERGGVRYNAQGARVK